VHTPFVIAVLLGTSFPANPNVSGCFDTRFPVSSPCDVFFVSLDAGEQLRQNISKVGRGVEEKDACRELALAESDCQSFVQS